MSNKKRYYFIFPCTRSLMSFDVLFCAQSLIRRISNPLLGEIQWGKDKLDLQPRSYLTAKSSLSLHERPCKNDGNLHRRNERIPLNISALMFYTLAPELGRYSAKIMILVWCLGEKYILHFWIWAFCHRVLCILLQSTERSHWKTSSGIKYV